MSFPFSFSSENNSAYPLPTNDYIPNHVFVNHGAHNSSSSSSSSEILLGLMKQNFVPKTETVKIVSHNGFEREGKSNSRSKIEEQNIKKPRFAFQTRSHVDVLDDGYRWRKYGQKAVKNNKFPRSYYRCTNRGCNVKKQVQRLTNDEGIVMTTYEGTHTHGIEKSTESFEHILNQFQTHTPF